MKNTTAFWPLALAVVLAAAAPKTEEAARAAPFTDEQLDARFHYDLGPAEVDVSKYPERRRADYEVFKRTCSRCHTPARALNAPYVERGDWERFVRRMHLKADATGRGSVSEAEARAAVDFLVFDARERKLRRKSEFAAWDRELRKLFEDIKKARAQREREKGEKGERRSAPYTGTKS